MKAGPNGIDDIISIRSSTESNKLWDNWVEQIHLLVL